MTKHNKYILNVIIILGISCNAYPQNIASQPNLTDPSKLMIGFGISTFGVGIESKWNITKKMSLHAGISHFKLNYPINILRDDIDGKISFAPLGISTTMDYKIYKNIFLSVGTTFNLSKISISGIPSESVWVGDIEIFPDEMGELKAELSPGLYISPYIGCGYIINKINSSNISVIIDGGIVYHGKPTVKLLADGMLTPTANEAQQKLIENNVSVFSYYPIISLVIFYDFR